MASSCFIRILLLVYVYSSLMLIHNGAINAFFINNDSQENLSFRDDKRSLSPIQSNPNLLEEYSTLLSPSDIKQRNVIMPRICYFARVSGTTVHQKLCLPYNDSKKT